MLGLSFRTLGLLYKVGNKNDTTGFYSFQNQVHSFNAHFSYMDLPADFTIQFRKNRNLPIAWEGGVVLSQLIHTNALQFNSSTRNFYHNNSLFNKTQVGLNTSISVTFLFKQTPSMLIGPYLYYGASQIAKEGLYANKHFVLTTLR